MKLIGSSTSAYVRKVRVVLAEKRLDYQFVEENPWSRELSPGTGNPLGKVPRLVMDGSDAMFDSRVIVEYLDTLSPVGKLIPGTGRERAEIKTWEALADGVLDAWIDFNQHGVWDYLASALICQEAGALIVEHQGRDLIVQEHSHRRTPIVAATPALLEIAKQIRDQK